MDGESRTKDLTEEKLTGSDKQEREKGKETVCNFSPWSVIVECERSCNVWQCNLAPASSCPSRPQPECELSASLSPPPLPHRLPPRPPHHRHHRHQFPSSTKTRASPTPLALQFWPFSVAGSSSLDHLHAWSFSSGPSSTSVLPQKSTIPPPPPETSGLSNARDPQLWSLSITTSSSLTSPHHWPPTTHLPDA